MNGYLIDTNVLSEFGKTQPPEPTVKQWIEAADPASLFASVVTWGELRKGIESKPTLSAVLVWNNGLNVICAIGFNPGFCG